MLGGRRFGNGARGGEEHAVGNAARLGGDGAEPDARIDVGVVGLVDAERPAVALDRRERTARADDGAAFGPFEQIPAASPRRARSDSTAEISPAGARGSAMARTTASWKACGWPDVPISTVGRALATTSPRPIRAGRRQSPRRQRRALLRKRRLKRLQARHAVDQQAVAIDQIETAARFGFAQARHRPWPAAAARKCRCRRSRRRTPRRAAR